MCRCPPGLRHLCQPAADPVTGAASGPSPGRLATCYLQAATPTAVAGDEFTFETAAPAAPAENGPPAAPAGAIPDHYLAAGGEVGSCCWLGCWKWASARKRWRQCCACFVSWPCYLFRSCFPSPGSTSPPRVWTRCQWHDALAHSQPHLSSVPPPCSTSPPRMWRRCPAACWSRRPPAASTRASPPPSSACSSGSRSRRSAWGLGWCCTGGAVLCSMRRSACWRSYAWLADARLLLLAGSLLQPHPCQPTLRALVRCLVRWCRQEGESKAGIKAAAGQYLESFYEVGCWHADMSGGVRRVASNAHSCWARALRVPVACPACAGRPPCLAFLRCCPARPVSIPSFLPTAAQRPGGAHPRGLHVPLTSAACTTPVCVCSGATSPRRSASRRSARRWRERVRRGQQLGWKGGCTGMARLAAGPSDCCSCR